MTRGGRAGTVGIVFLVAAAACRQLVGIGDQPPTGIAAATDGGVDVRDDAAGACGLAYQATCGPCVAASCCGAATACSIDPVCAPYMNCLAGCNGVASCESQCLVDNPIGESSTVAAIFTCLATSCKAECNLPCGNLATGFAPPDAASACSKCIAAEDCDAAQACAQSTDCIALGECVLACGPGFDCEEQCFDTHEAGAATFDSFDMLFNGTCATPCAYGNWWSCVGHVTPPKALVASTTVAIGALGFVSGAPIAGLQALACRAADPGCTSPLSDGGTDTTGYVSLTLPQGVGGPGFDGYYQLWSPDGGVVPTLGYLSTPLREAAVHFTLSFIAPTDLQGVLTGLGVTQGSGGYIAVIAYDCFDNKAPGVRFSVNAAADAGVQIFYLQGALPTSGATMTDPSGAALITNVPAGTIDIVATPSDLGGQPSGHLTVSVEEGKVTQVLLFPD
jgi:hypothetical protein